MRTKLMVLFSLILAVLCGLVGRLTYIEHTKGETYQKKVLSMQSYDSKTIPYQRGEIIDRSGTVLATSVAVYNVILDCTVVNDKEEYVDPTVEALVKCFPELDETEIRRIIKEKKDKRYIVLAKKVPYDEVQPFVELQDAVDKKGNKVNPANSRFNSRVTFRVRSSNISSMVFVRPKNCCIFKCITLYLFKCSSKPASSAILNFSNNSLESHPLL